MLTFYYNPLSPNCRRVWLMLLEKNLDFEPILLKLNGDQLRQDFIDLNPFHHVPVVVDQDTRLIESLAILDYLDQKYPEPCLIPKASQQLANIRMVQLLTVNELMPSLLLHIYAEPSSPQLHKSNQQLALTLNFLMNFLVDTPFFSSDTLSVADIVAGTVIPLLKRVGVSLDKYPPLNHWCDRIQSRPTWQMTDLSAAGWHEFQRRIQIMAKRRQTQRNQMQLKPLLPKRQGDPA